MCTEIVRNKFVWKKDSCEVAAIDQPIMQCVQPVSLMIPFSLFLGVDLLSRYGLKYLVEKPSQFGFCKGKNAALISEVRELFVNED